MEETKGKFLQPEKIQGSKTAGIFWEMQVYCNELKVQGDEASRKVSEKVGKSKTMECL